MTLRWQQLFYILFLVVGRRTAFEVDWLFQQTLHIFHGNETFHSIVSAFNDFYNDRYNQKVTLHNHNQTYVFTFPNFP